MNLLDFINSGIQLNKPARPRVLIATMTTESVAELIGCAPNEVDALAEGNEALERAGDGVWNIWTVVR